MARQETVVVSLECDICGREAVESHTMTFGTGSRPAVWEIDLCAADGKKLAKAEFALVSLLDRGRKVSGGRQRAAAAAKPSSRGSKRSSDAAAIRQWAREAGYEVSDRGRIGADLREAFKAAR